MPPSRLLRQRGPHDCPGRRGAPLPTGLSNDYGARARRPQRTKRQREDTADEIASMAGCRALLVAVPSAAVAQATQPWPERTIQAIVPFAAGAANDIVGRIVLEQVS